MSVPKSKRKISESEYLHNAYVIRTELTKLLFREFGFKPTKKSLITLKSSQNKYYILLHFLNRFFSFTPKIFNNYPEWFIEEESRQINQYCCQLNDFLIIAEAKKSNKSTYKHFINKSISVCKMLLKELQFILLTLKLNLEKYVIYINLINKEILLLEDQIK